MKIVFATNNAHKLEEVQFMLGTEFEILGLRDIGCEEEIPETALTLEGNARLKAQHIWEKYGYSCFADDTGLEISTLDGAPGVFSARYAGEDKNAEDNMGKVLHEMVGEMNREAQFRTIVCLIKDGREHLFEGIVKGSILKEKVGEKGFGYDPIFQPEGYEKSFAQLSMEEKNKISHRGRAIKKLVGFLKGDLD